MKILYIFSLFSQGLKHPSRALFDISMCIVASLSNLFIYCYFGKMACNSFEKVASSMYESAWVDLPLELQKYLVVTIQNAQRPVIFKGFNIYHIDLETFAQASRQFERFHFISFSKFNWISFQILKKVFSVYMMFKTLTEWASTIIWGIESCHSLKCILLYSRKWFQS